MRRFIGRFFAVIGFLVVLIVAVAAAAWIFFAPGKASLGGSNILVLDLNRSYGEAPTGGGIAALFSEDELSLRDLLDGIEQAGADPKIKGLIAHVGSEEYGSGQGQEIREAIAAFRAKGKFAIAHAESFGELGPGTRSYYLATAFDQILLQPFGMVGLTGIRAEVPFAKELLDKLGVDPRFEHRSEYKTAMNSLTEKGMTPAHREETQSIIDSIYGQIVRDIAASRHFDEAGVRQLVDGGPYLYDEAQARKLIDGIGYWSDAVKTAQDKAGGAKTVTLRRYLDIAGHPHDKGPVIALVYATGLIQSGESVSNPLSGSSTLGSDTLIRALRKAGDDKDVRAILFRIDSPGGSATASETIWHEVTRIRDAGKPIIVCMGDVAGSGGYYIAASATKIVAQPGTLTGSIGVVAGKIMTQGLWDKLGVHWDTAEAGANASMYSTIQDFSPQGKQRFEQSLDQIYAGFKGRVAIGRKLSPDKVEEIARGRVWTGEDAKARGLVDELGGYETALRLAKEAAKIAPDQDVTLKTYPPPEGARQALLARLLGRDDEDNASASLALAGRSLLALRPLLRQLEMLSAPPGTLVMWPSGLGPGE